MPGGVVSFKHMSHNYQKPFPVKTIDLKPPFDIAPVQSPAELESLCNPLLQTSLQDRGHILHFCKIG